MKMICIGTKCKRGGYAEYSPPLTIGKTYDLYTIGITTVLTAILDDGDEYQFHLWEDWSTYIYSFFRELTTDEMRNEKINILFK